MFQNYFSLGQACNLAASMSKLGIRDFSGPFDWYVSSLQGVIECLENDFEDFLNINYLCAAEDPKKFIDKKYNFRFIHEINTTLDKDYNTIYDRYQKKIAVFKQKRKLKSCFLRTITFEEMNYIKFNHSRITNVIKKYNSDNTIIYIVINPPNFKFEHPFYPVVYSYKNYLNNKSLRSLFDSNKQLQEYLLNNYDVNKRNKNMVFDLQKENKRLEILEYKNVLLTEIEKMNIPTFNDPISIYGAGIAGKAFYNKIKENNKIVCFIDKSSNNKQYNNVPILTFDEFKASKYYKSLVVVTPTYLLSDITTFFTNNNFNNYISIEELFK